MTRNEKKKNRDIGIWHTKAITRRHQPTLHIFDMNYGLFAPKTIRSRERKFQEWNFRSLELLHPGTHQWIQPGAYSLLHWAYICYTLWTIIIERSQLNVTKRLPIGLPNIFGFVVTQWRVFLRLFVTLGVYSSGTWQIGSYLLHLSPTSEVSFDCGTPTRFSAHLGLYVLLNSTTSYR